jgi:small-conductance mechanosensitive channel
VENLTDADQKFNLTTQIVVGADSNVAQVREVLKSAALAQARVLEKPEPSVFLVNFAPDGLEFSLSFYINDPMNGQANVKSAVNIAVLEGLRAASIEIPFPQRVLHIQNNSGGAIPASQG